MKAAKYLFAAAAAAAMLACGGAGNRTGKSGGSGNDGSGGGGGRQLKYSQFTPAVPPAAIPPEEQNEWLREHFWDRFEFADSAYVAAQDTAVMVQLFAVYAVQMVGAGDTAPMARLMKRAEASPAAFGYFMFLADYVLHDPNSPLRDDELYIPVLESIIASPLAAETDKTAARYRLRMAMQNRPGSVANDFAFTDIDGRTSSLHETRAEWVLLFFSNPGCPLCAQITGQLQASEIITHATQSGRLKIISLYPDDDADEWRAHAGDMPRQWTYARDARHEIRDRQLYDLRAIPALYLLDSQKRVTVKDASEISLVEMQLARRTTVSE